MALNYVWTSSIKVPGLPSLPADDPVTVSGDASVEYEFSVAAGQNTGITVPSVDKTKLVGVVISSTLPGTFHTNSSNGSGGDSFTLVAKKAVNWNSSSIFSNVITANVTALYFDNTAGTAAATVRVAFLSNL
jgi:hypothetical protein